MDLQVDDWRRVLPVDKAQNFVDGRPGRFMHPQASSRMVSAFPDAAENASTVAGLRGCAVMLIGDAAHCSPPGAHKSPR
jgi:2-polyprenyl-6-methoxyphenol hydroxylase-like FAD-dependent oxidoreductase